MEFSAAITQKKQLLLLRKHKNTDEGYYGIFSSFDEIVECNGVPNQAISIVASERNIDYEEFLDI